MNAKITSIGGLIVIATIGLALVSWTWRRVHYPIQNAPVAGSRIIAFGDSLVTGVGALPDQDFVSRLSRSFGRPIVNAGVAGDTTATALGRLDVVLTQRPDLVIVLLGGNDALTRVPVAQTVDNMRAIIQRLQSSGAAVLLIGVRGGFIGDPYHRPFARLARELHTAYVPNVLDGILGTTRLMADAVHPNAIGYGIMAERILPALQSLLSPSLP